MSENTKIEWCDHTFNPWIGCTKVSDGCKNCYAERQDNHRKWTPEGWGKGKPRKRTSEANWKQVELWNRQTGKALDMFNRNECGGFEPRRRRVFVASLADWLDPEVPVEWLADLLDLIRRCPNLDFLMLTKRPELFTINEPYKNRIEEASHEISSCYWADEEESDLSKWVNAWIDGNPPENVWIGTSVENQKAAEERIPELLKIPAKVRFLSCEPLLSMVDLERIPLGNGTCLTPVTSDENGDEFVCNPAIHWVICGGESGPNARPMHPDWARSLRDQCQAAGVLFFFKQWGEWMPLCWNATDEFPWKCGSHRADGGGEDRPKIFSLGDYGSYLPVNKRENICGLFGKKKSGRLLDGREWSEFPTTI